MLAWLLAAVASAPAAAAPRPAADFAELPFIEGPVLSPDGKNYAAKLAVKGEFIFAVVPLDGSAPRLSRVGSLDLNWWRWVDDNWLVVGVGDTKPIASEDWYFRRAVAVSADTKTIRMLEPRGGTGQNADDVLWTSTATGETPRLLLAAQQSIYFDDPGFYPSVVEFDLAKGTQRTVVRPVNGVSNWFADPQGVVRMGIGYLADGRSSRLLYRAQPSEGFRTIDRADTRKRTTLTAPALFLPEPGKALAFHDDDKGFTTLYEFDLTTQTLGKPVIGVPDYDLARVTVARGEARLLGVAVETTRPEIRWTDPDLATLQAEVDKSVGAGRHATVISMSRNQQRLIIHVGTPAEPGRYYAMDRGEGVMRPIGHVAMKFKKPLHPVRTVRYTARDGVSISAVVTEPVGKPARAPLIVMPHGGPFARDTEGWDWWAQFLADRGYVVIQPNYRGSSGFGTAFTQLGEGQWGLAMQDDLDDAVAWAGREGVADAARACIVGASYGGYAAMRAAQRGGKPYRCAVSYAGVSDLPRLRRYDSQFLLGGVRSDWLARQAPDLRLVSPLNYPEQVSLPLLLVHGKLDKRVPVDQSRAMASRLRKLGKDVTYIEQPLADHHFSRAEDRLQFLEAMEAFLKVHNPA
ncbi:S9 family peptidase [Glacieibacterium frigidum]|uniref:S9 family peptidase n=1 Tax=Glacieibacterium frigidum TaxID=2593303 RepID=A0A552UAN0_9SPHN|nr:S9 family peptidase [Glacieibacterium frigidum]